MVLNNCSRAIKSRSKLKNIRLKSQDKIAPNALYEKIVLQ